MQRKLRPALIALFLLIICQALAFGQTLDATTTPDHITLTWNGNPATTMTVTWRTDAAVKTGTVEYQKESGISGNPLRADAKVSDFTTDLQATHIFTATLTGLSPDTKYSYRVGDGEHWSTKHIFSTANPANHDIKFLVFGDSQSVANSNPPYGIWSKTVHNAYKANPDASFMVNVGDLVDSGQNGAHWNSWFTASEGVIDTIPIMPTTGNHETLGSKDTRRPAYWNAQFKLPQNGPSRLKNQVYSYDLGPVHFVVLDSQQDEEKQYGDIFTAQEKWLDADLAASDAQWKIVFFHKAPYEIHDTRSGKSIREAFCPVLEKHHVDVVFNGHDHGVARTYPIKNGAYLQNPSQGTIYYICGRSGSKTYSDLEKKKWDTYFYNPQDQPVYLVVKASDTKLTVNVFKQDGALLDTFSIAKESNRNQSKTPVGAGVSSFDSWY